MTVVRTKTAIAVFIIIPVPRKRTSWFKQDVESDFVTTHWISY